MQPDLGSERSVHVGHASTGPLSPWVQTAVGYDLSGFAAGVHVGLPSGALTLVIPIGQALTVADGPGPPLSYAAVLAGLSGAPSFIHHDGTQCGVQLALRPGAVRALVGAPAALLVGASYELEDVLGPVALRLRDRVHESGDWRARFAAVDAELGALAARTSTGRGPDPEVTEAWRVIRRSAGRVAIGRVAAHVGWSMRRLQARFREEYGLSPKTAAVVARFEQSVPLVRHGVGPLGEIAARCGWSDQAHMDRDWRALAGSAPSRWRVDDVLAVH